MGHCKLFRNLFLLLLLILNGCSNEHNFTSPTAPNPSPGFVTEVPNQFVEEVFLQPNRQPVDIIFVIDQSCSMWDDWLTLTDNIHSFFELLDDYWIDYRIAVTSTDASSSNTVGEFASYRNYQWVSPYSKPYTPEDLFWLLNGVLSGQGEQGIDSTWGMFHQARDANKDFFRIGAPLHIILLSDEEDQSEWITPRQLADYLVNQLPVWKEHYAFFHSVVTPPENCSTGWWETPGTQYFKVTQATKGMHTSICDVDWQHIWSRIVEDYTQKEYKYSLKYKPVKETLLVLLEREGVTYSLEENIDFLFLEEANTIQINWEWEDDDKLIVQYYKAEFYTQDTG